VRWLVIASQLGDRTALNELLQNVQESLFHHLAYLLPSRADAEDALQDTLLTISRKIGSLREARWFNAWAFRIATRLALRRNRRSRAAPPFVDVDDIDTLPAPMEEPWLLEDERVAIREVLQLVPPASQLVLRMQYVSGLSHAEIAEALNISIGTVKSRASYGLQWLRDHLQGQHPAGRRVSATRKESAG
jgi:RNA polymerase sigma-70 factor (ECF subfamily)